MVAKKTTTKKKTIKVPKDFYKTDAVEVQVPGRALPDNVEVSIEPMQEKVNQVVAEQEPKPGFNRFGVCLACNNNNPDCTHNSLSQGAGGVTVCNICGIVIN